MFIVAAPPLRSFSFHHCAPQNVTAVPIAAFLSPITKVPPATPAKISTLQLVVAVLPPTSAIETVIVRIVTDRGVCGLGSASPEAHVTGETNEQCQAALKEDLLQWLVGRVLRPRRRRNCVK